MSITSQQHQSESFQSWVPIASWKDICWMEFRSYVQEIIHVVPTQTAASGQSEIDGANDREGKGWLVAGLL